MEAKELSWQEEKKALIAELTNEKDEHLKAERRFEEFNQQKEKLQKALDETQKTLLQTQRKLAEEKKNNGQIAVHTESQIALDQRELVAHLSKELESIQL